MERRDLTARAARDRLAALLQVGPDQLAGLNHEQAAAMADELAALRLRQARVRHLPARTA